MVNDNINEKEIIIREYLDILKENDNDIIDYCNNICKKCNFCNNCLFCELNKRLYNVLDWLEYIIKNNIKKNELDEKYIYKYIELKNSASFHYDNLNSNTNIILDFKYLFDNFDNIFRTLINFCLNIIVDKKINNTIINDKVIVELFNNILQNILKVKGKIISLIIIDDIKNNNVCKYINNEIINKILLYFKNNDEIIMNFINEPNYYEDYLTNLFYIDYVDEI